MVADDYLQPQDEVQHIMLSILPRCTREQMSGYTKAWLIEVTVRVLLRTA